MIPFGRSASLYDLLYADLPTSAEVDAVLARLSAPRSVIDLGCGTGRHAAEMARRGIEVVGIDRSEGMVACARARGVDARVADLSSARLGRTFDAAIALFPVFVYATTDDELDAFIATARAHLAAGGRFAFDTWNADAVAASAPTAREKKVTRDGRTIVRRATPTLRGEVIEVRYEYETDTEIFVELHTVRPRDAGSLERHLVRGGFRARQLVTSAEPGDYDLLIVAEAR